MAKILHIITRLDRGGSAQNTLLTCHLLAKKYDMILIHGLSFESRMTEKEKWIVDKEIQDAEKVGVKVIPIPSLVQRINPIKDMIALFSLIKIIHGEKPDIVHTHTSKAGFLGRWAAKIARVRHIIHTPHGHVFYGHFGRVASKFFLLIEKFTSPITEKLIALTDAEREDYIYFNVAGADKLISIHSGVNIDRFQNSSIHVEEKKRDLGIQGKDFVVGTVGWLLRIKGPMILMKAMAYVWRKYPDCHLVYVGKGDLEEEMRHEVDRMGVSDHVHFLGWRDDIPEIMPVFDVFVLPSLNEGMGRVLVEAMAAGRPVVASKVGGIVDIVKHGQNGLLVEPADVEGLGKAITELLENREGRVQMGNRGRQLAPHYSIERMIENLDTLYASLLGIR